MSRVETVLHGNPPVRESGAVDPETDRVIVQHTRGVGPQRVGKPFVVFRITDRQIAREWWYVFIEIVFFHEHENHAVHFFYRVTRYPGRTDDLVVRRGDDRDEFAAFEVERVTVIPARDRAVGQAQRFFRQADAAVQALILQGIDFALRPTQYDRDAADFDPFRIAVGEFRAEQRGIPVVDEAPLGILVVLVELLLACTVRAVAFERAAAEALFRSCFRLAIAFQVRSVGFCCAHSVASVIRLSQKA